MRKSLVISSLVLHTAPKPGSDMRILAIWDCLATCSILVCRALIFCSSSRQRCASSWIISLTHWTSALKCARFCQPSMRLAYFLPTAGIFSKLAFLSRASCGRVFALRRKFKNHWLLASEVISNSPGHTACKSACRLLTTRTRSLTKRRRRRVNRLSTSFWCGVPETSCRTSLARGR